MTLDPTDEDQIGLTSNQMFHQTNKTSKGHQSTQYGAAAKRRPKDPLCCCSWQSQVSPSFTRINKRWCQKDACKPPFCQVFAKPAWLSITIYDTPYVTTTWSMYVQSLHGSWQHSIWSQYGSMCAKPPWLFIFFGLFHMVTQVQSPHGFSWCSMTQPNGYSSPLFVDSTQFAIAVVLGKERFDLLPICFTAERNKKTISVATNLTNLPLETHCFRNITSNFMQCVGFPFFKQKCIYFNW